METGPLTARTPVLPSSPDNSEESDVGDRASRPRCSFYVRYPEDEGWRYEAVFMSTPTNYLVTDHPPSVGDHIHLRGQTEETKGQFVVVARSWLHSAWGSTNWPYGEDESTVGPMLDIIVEPSKGVFVNEVIRDEDEPLTDSEQ